MLPCEEVRELAEEYVSETLEPARHAEVVRHVQVCQSCHRVIEEARLARRVLHDTGAPPAPPRLADRIKLAACTRLSRRPRSLHERALGSPVFLATCASLLCGAVICLLAIMKVAYVQPWPPPLPPDVTVVETYRLPTRNLAGLSTPGVAATPAVRRSLAAPLKHRALAQIGPAPRPAPRPASSSKPAPPVRQVRRPARGLMAIVAPIPAMGVSPHLPTPTVAPAGIRISRPDRLAEPVAAEAAAFAWPVAREHDERLELAPAAAPEAAARGDFTTNRP